MKAVIFDMDGVIVDSEPRHERAFLAVLREIGYDGRNTLQFADYIGRSDQEMWRAFVAAHQPPQAFEELLALKRKHTLDILERERPIFPGLPDLVEKVAARYALAVASGSERPVVDAVLRLGGLQRFFPIIVTGSDVPQGKPAPDIFLRTAEILAVPADSCWVIEDSKPGIAAGLAAGMRVIAITNTHSAKELASATHVVSNYAEIATLLLPD